MDMIVYKTALVVHVVGIATMAGATFIDFSGFNHFWKTLSQSRASALTQADGLYRLQRFMGIGMALIILSGVGMMAYLHQVWGQQVWFRIKMGLLLLIIINGLAIRRRLGNRLKKLLAEEAPDAMLLPLQGRIRTMHLVQLLFFITIFVLSVFKFN